MFEFKLSNLNYNSDLIEYYKKFLDLPGFVLLESIDKTRGRYDILSACPYDKVKLSSESVVNSVVFNLLQEKIPTHNFDLDLPFQGGAIGFFSYDLACHLAGIKYTPEPGLKGMALLEVGFYDWAIIVDHYLKKITVFSANTQSNTAKIVEEVISRWHGPTILTPEFLLTTSFMPLISKRDYEDAFYAIHADLKIGRCYQVNYTQRFNAQYTGSTWAIYEKIRASNPVPFAAFLPTDYADILCFSPERFIKMENYNLLASPIKGTEKRDSNEKIDQALRQKLLECGKNRAENVMIVDLLRNDFGKIAKPGSVSVNGLCEIESYEAIHHLVSHISAECQNTISMLQAFSACFPGGSISGAPKLESMRVISEQEIYSRGIYCGNIGYFSRHGRFDTNIAIRTITACNNTLHLSAGGGIVIDSKFEEEYLECYTKIKGIINSLG